MLKKIIAFLTKMKPRGEMEDVASKEYIRTQNPYAMLALVVSGAGFVIPQYGLSIITLIFCILTYCTFDKETEDNPWPFYLGILISLAGLMIFVTGEVHQIIM